MHYIGVDLAWGTTNPTGLAVLDAEARLLHVSTVQSDDDIVQALEPFTGGDCLVAIDAPLVVRNATGSRPAERELNRDFRRFEAGAHPSNTGKAEFANGTRGGRLVKRLGLDMDPRSGRARRALEVYPHPATVVLFHLNRTLKYKQKQGRDLELLRSELLKLMAHVETIVVTDQAWAALRHAVETATRKSQLRVVEDQVDAVVCAYVGLFADTRPERTHIYGDLTDGYIVTPALPDGSEAIRKAVESYVAGHPTLVQAADDAVGLVTGILDEAGINYLTISGRAKSITSFAEKATRRDGEDTRFPEPLRDITDQIGVRVITYVRDDVAAVAGLLADQVVVTDDRDMGLETAREGRFGYQSRHLQFSLDAARASAHPLLRDRTVQVQIRTVLQHAWAEFEHDIRYKGVIPTEHATDFDRRFTLAAGLLELADQEFSTIRDRLRSPVPESTVGDADDPRLDPRELAAYLAGQYADAGWSRSEHYLWISGLLLELGITSLDELGGVMRAVDEPRLREQMGYRYPPGAVRRLDDSLLATFTERYLALHGNVSRIPLLRQRLERIVGE